MMKSLRLPTLSTLTLALTLGLVSAMPMVGCSNKPKKEERRQVTAADFVAPSSSSQDSASATPNQLALPDPVFAQASPDAPAASSPPDHLQLQSSAPTPGTGNPSNPEQIKPLTMDAMVGQVNGRAIYASAVFDPVSAQLAALGRTLPPSVFKQRATEIIVGQLQTIITNALILGEAERDLSQQERYGLVAMLKTQREEILRKFGQGSVALADQNSLEATGKNVDQQVDEIREQMLVARYLNNKVRPKINVSRKDIERYYESKYAEFNPPAGRTIRLIMTSSKTDADHIQAMLEKGTNFETVAKQPLNQYRASSGGLWPNRIEGDKFSSYDALNQAMLALKEGEHSSRIEAGSNFWWVKVETLEDGKGRSLEEVQLDIRTLLENQQRDALGMEFRRKLLQEGSYNPIDEMTASLVEIAMSRYSQQN